MNRSNQIKDRDIYSKYKPPANSLSSKTRLNVNDLIKKRQKENKEEKKKNSLIFTFSSAIAIAIFIILGFSAA